ncbi:MAG: ATP-binding protein [Thermoanaerobaculia bacterium]|nr:ATP-binding protein [Thermoanaerobaculia bacterium]
MRSTASLLRFLSFVGLLSIIFAIAVALFLHVETGLDAGRLVVAAVVVVLVLFTLPFTGLFLFGQARLRQVETLTDRTRALVGREAHEMSLETGLFPELADLARILEEWRHQTLQLNERFDQNRALTVEILDSIGEGLLAVGRDRKIVLANRRLAELVDIHTSLIGKPFLEVVRSAQLATAVDRALEGETSSYRESVDAEGRQRTIEVRVFPVKEFSDAAAVALFIDVSLIERLEGIRRDFISDFSHEVRTPMAGLRSAVETFEMGGLSPEDEAQLRSIVTRQLDRLQRLVRDLSELNAIESGDLVLRPERLDLRGLLVHVAQEFGASSAPGVVVEGEPVELVADRLRVEQVFSNLIDNALKYGDGSSAVQVEVQRHGDEAVVRVTDRGPGIPARDLERIFNRFYRVDRSRSQVSGSGLGLAITKHLVQLHRGSISATSRLNEGSTFEVRLPLDRVA